jgi:hypothetical protein
VLGYIQTRPQWPCQPRERQHLHCGRDRACWCIPCCKSAMLCVAHAQVFVAGSTGKTGRRVVQQLRAAGYKVRAGVRVSGSSRPGALYTQTAHKGLRQERAGEWATDCVGPAFCCRLSCMLLMGPQADPSCSYCSSEPAFCKLRMTSTC